MVLQDEKSSGSSSYEVRPPAHTLPFDQVLEKLNADAENGLSDGEATSRRAQCGPNELEGGGSASPLKILIHQVANALTLVLVMAMVASFAIKSWIEGGVITFVILLNIVVGFFQEYSAEKTLASIRALGSPTATVVREGQTKVIPTAEIVPGDIVMLATGNTIPADLRLIECMNLETDEALLTGESLPVAKVFDRVFDEDFGAGDRLNIAFSSATVTKGRGKGVVISTGMQTEIGKIAAALRHKKSNVRHVKRKEDGTASVPRYAEAGILTAKDAIGHFLGVNVGTPLQRKLSKLAIFLFGIAVLCALIVEAANKFSNQNEVIIYAVATGLSMIPASLIVVLTITMAVGTKRMSKRNVIVRKLDSLEALGAVTNICSDKTGTLTQGKMVAKAAWICGHGTYQVKNTGEPFNPLVGDVSHQDGPPTDIAAEKSVLDAEKLLSGQVAKDHPCVDQYLNVASLANVAHLSRVPEGHWNARGDPTEIAIQVFATRFNRNRQSLLDSGTWSCLSEFPFDSDVKRMSVIYESTSSSDSTRTSRHVFTKGAVERVLELCTHSQDQTGNAVLLDEQLMNMIWKNVDALANDGLRVLCLASKPWNVEKVFDYTKLDRSAVEKDLTFLGLIGLYDPPRPESAASVASCQKAGIVVHMLTGDHIGTARAIAKQVGILPKDDSKLSADVAAALAMTGGEFDKMTEDEIDALPNLPFVIGRCQPSTKVRMIEALHRRNRFAAMTGDGVNDSPSLVRADVGIAMGQGGSDVAKDASDLILMDDNFASILNAIEEGRRLFDNIKRFVLHVLAENIAQATTLLVGLAFKDATGNSVFPLAPVQILWVIMATSGMPDMGLGMEVADPDIMDRPPHDLKTGIFSWEVIIDMLVYGIWMSILCLASFVLVVYGFGDGNLGADCNTRYSKECDLVFRARATTFVCLTWFALFLAWEMVDFRRSFFRQKPRSGRKYAWYNIFIDWWNDSRENTFLFWAIIAGFVTIFPTLYIPVINHDVFKHEGITWEWAIVVIESILFFGGCELWKLAKRVYFRRQASKVPVDSVQQGTGAFNSFESGGTTQDVERQ